MTVVVGLNQAGSTENRVEALGLLKEAVGDVHPPRRRVDECLHGGDLTNDQDRERVQVNLVNPVFDDEVADHAETNQSVHPGWREILGANRRETSGSETTKLVAVPVLAAHAATPGEAGDRVIDLDTIPADDMIAAPNDWCPNPAYTNCLRVRGNSMSPLINDGDIVAVDSAQTNPELLNGKIVITWQKQRGLVISRFQCVQGLQLLECENREYEPVVLGNNRDWRMIGRVLWWVCRAL
jgi:SOS-response transcriptional repressor LexA